MRVRAIIATSWMAVAPCSRTWRQKLRALYFSSTTRLAPAASTGMRAASWKFEWKAGMVVSMRSSGPKAHCQSP